MKRRDIRRVEDATKYVEKVPRQRPNPHRVPRGSTILQRWFYTTGTITAAAVTGSGVSTGTLTQGHGNARMCLTSAAGVVKPITSIADTVIYNGLLGNISANQFVLCNLSDSGIFTVCLTPC